MKLCKVKKKCAGNQPTFKKEGSKGKGLTSKIRCTNCGAKAHLAEKCPNKARGARCFNCSEFGHIAPNCPNKSRKEGMGTGNQVNLIAIPDTSIKIGFGNTVVVGLIDTGSDVSLVRASVLKLLDVPQSVNHQGIYLSGFGQSLRKTIGSFCKDVLIDGEVYPIRWHVVPDSWIPKGALIGKDWLRKAKITIEGGIVKTHRLGKSELEVDQSPLEHINVVQLIEDRASTSIDDICCKESREVVRKLVESYTPQKLEKSCIQMKISLEDDAIVYQKPRRLAPKEREIVAKQIDEWLQNGIIRASNSNFASPIVLVKKKNDTYRLCVDCRRLNQKIVKDRYPLPLIEDILENLHHARVFTSLDLKNGFFHVDISEESRKYTSFVTPDGQFEFLKAPFGLCNSPSVFQRFINCVFQPLVQKGVLFVYLDDIIIPSKTDKENIEKLKLTLDVAAKNGLNFNWKKSKFLKQSIEFLGHILEDGKMKPSEEKIAAVKNFPQPRKVKDVQSFLGLTGFFRKFIPHYALIAKPLTELLRKNSSFTFGLQQQDAFNQLKDALCSDPVLKLVDPSAETELHTDASREGCGAVLLQRHNDDNYFHPVFYLSYNTSKVEKNYSSYELEVLAIIKALKKLRTYLLGLKFKIHTDCKAFHLTRRKKELSSRVARWALILEEYDCTVVHKAGSTMRHVDALSRYPKVCAIESEVMQRIRKAQAGDEKCKLIRKLLENDAYEDYILRNDILYKFVEGVYLLVVPKVMQRTILRNIHEQGHLNAHKVETLARQEYFIPEVKKKIEAVLSNCVSCILAARKSGKQECIVNPIEKADLPLHTYHVDHLGPLASTSKSYKYIFVVVDAFTKFCWIYPVKDTTTSEVIRKLELQSEVFGHPYRIISDRGTAFTSNGFRSYCEEKNIYQVLITTGVPRGNGQVERLNQSIISLLSKLSTDDPQKWYRHVPSLQRFLNSTTSRATGRTPFELLIGVKMRRPEHLELLQALEKEIVEQFEEARDELRKGAKEQIKKIQEENKKYSLRKRKPARKYDVHDLVAIKRTQFMPGSKLYPKFLGPYEVTRVKSKDRYDVQKIGQHEGPNTTSSAADYMKLWSTVEDESLSEADEIQDGRVWEE